MILIFLVVTVLTILNISAVVAANDTSTISTETLNNTITQSTNEQANIESTSVKTNNSQVSYNNVNTVSDDNKSSSMTSNTSTSKSSSYTTDSVTNKLSVTNDTITSNSSSLNNDVNNVSTTISESNIESTNTVDNKNIVSNNTGNIASINSTQNSTTTLKTSTQQSVIISVDPVTVNTGDTITLNATLTYTNGTAVPDNKLVVFKINGNTINKTTTKNGTASLIYTVPNLAGNNYTLTVKIGTTATTKTATAETNFTVLKTNTSIIIDRLFFGVSGNKTIIHATILDANGNTVRYGKVCFKLNGKTIQTVSTVNGVASVTCDLSSVKTGLYNITVIYGENSYYNTARTIVNLKVQSSTISFTRDQVLEASTRVKSFIETNSVLPNYVTINGTKVSMINFLYLMCQALNSNTSLVAGNFNNGTYAYNTTSNQNIYKTEYMSLSRSILDCFALNGRSPRSISVSGGTLSFGDTVYFYARITAYIYNNGVYPNYSTSIALINTTTSSNNSTDNTNTSDTIPSGYEQYLVATKNCQVTNNIIQNLATTITSGISGSYNKAVAIFNYLNDNTDYSYYSNTLYGALGTWNRGYGNCVDLSHLCIAVMRAAGIPARYVHATSCTFSSGLVVGHVWAEVYVNGQWYKCDLTSSRNTFGVINNWYKCSGVTRYISLPF